MRFISRDADAVVEIRDLAALAKSREKVIARVSPVVTREQIAALEQELAAALGFNPASTQGLEEAGLPGEGRVAVEIVSGGEEALWAIPVKEAARFEKALDRIARLRATIQSSEKIKVGGKDGTILWTSFGPERVAAAAYHIGPDVALVAVGRTARERLEKALVLGSSDPSTTILGDPEYAALARALGSSFEVRITIPAAGRALAGASASVGRLAGGAALAALGGVPESKSVKSAGWVLRFIASGVELEGRLRLEEGSLRAMKSVIGHRREAPSGVRAIQLEDAFLLAFISADVAMLMKELAPTGSPARVELDQVFARVKRDLDTDVEREVLPLLSGHGAIALGVGSIAGLDIRELLQNPARILWTLIAVGTSDPEKLLGIEKRLDTGLEARGFSVRQRTAGGREIHAVGRKVDDAQPPEVLVESVGLEGARIYSNEPAMTDRVLGAKAPPGAPLGGMSGALVEVRMGVLHRGLSSLDLTALPVLYRAIAAKVLDTLRILDRISIEASSAEDGVRLLGRVELAAAKPDSAAP